MALGGGSVPSLSQIHAWDTTHLEDAATHWSSRATEWEDAFAEVHERVLSPGGTPWQGIGADAAFLRTGTDKVAVSGIADCLHSAAAAAREGAGDIGWAKQSAIQAVEQAQAQGFTVGEDLSVTDRSSAGLPAAARAARQLQAETLAADIRAQAQNLVAVDTAVATRISTATAGLSTVQFADAPSNGGAAQRGDNPKKPKFQTVDNHTFKQDGGDPAPDPPPPTPPARGLPPEGLHPPVDGPLTPGPASRPSEQGKGGQSLWDEHGGEWRYFPGDKWHNPHWDYNPHSNPNSPWDNIPINGLPPRIGQAPPIISGLPPWLQTAPGTPGPPQNPLLAPFPGVTMPTPTPPPAQAPGPSLIPHIDIPAPSPGDLQTAGGETAVVGGGGLLLLILGALALA